MAAINYGELYYDHYVKYLGEPIDREVFRASEETPSIQILKYEHVFEDCLVYATLGLSHFEQEVGAVVEVSMAVDGAFDSAGYILASALFYCIANQMRLGRGTAIGGVEHIAGTFTQQYNKHAVYFTDPYAFPEAYYQVRTGTEERDGTILLAFFISQAEYDYFVTHGTEKFEELLEAKEADPFHVGRPSIV